MTPPSTLRQHIADRYGVRTLSTSSCSDFANLIEAVRERMKKEGYRDDALPLLGSHVNPSFSVVHPDEFIALCGFDSTGRLVSTNTARAYPLDPTDGIGTLRRLMESCRLWFDDPDLMAPLMRCEVISDDPRFDEQPGLALHVGSAWTAFGARGEGLGSAMVALHRLEADAILGPAQMFGTTVATKSGSWTGRAEPDGTATVCMFAPGDENGVPEVQHIRIWSPSDMVRAAERVITQSKTEGER